MTHTRNFPAAARWAAVRACVVSAARFLSMIDERHLDEYIERKPHDDLSLQLAKKARPLWRLAAELRSKGKLQDVTEAEGGKDV